MTVETIRDAMETLEHKTQCCPRLARHPDWLEVAENFSLSTLCKLDDICDAYIRFGDPNYGTFYDDHPIVQWYRDRITTDQLLQELTQ